MTNPTPSPRIAVSGAGPGGLTCARVLQLHGFDVTVLELDASPDARPQGGTLDLHEEDGQVALKAAGLLDRFLELARPEGQEWRTLDAYSGRQLDVRVPPEGATERPEIDRGTLRSMLLESLAPGTVRWGKGVASAEPLEGGGCRVVFRDGSSEDFGLVVGADGAWSRVRAAISEAVPAYTGVTFVSTGFEDADVRHRALADRVGPGTMMARADGKGLCVQRNGGGYLDCAAMLRVPEEWRRDGFEDQAGVRAELLELYGDWHEDLRYVLRESERPLLRRPLYALPAPHEWRHVAGVTLLGDAAHLMPPLGVGANLAMLDGAELGLAVATAATPDEGVRAYESVMLPRSARYARECAEGLKTFLPEGGAMA
ncbi:NAD(P)/FAD-dependent oxidoreductase [Streptantibioticus parmotrematis]|uniref:FAD-dependent oxidoreductase n=1 Tax=Streptantibioticus parmotrematis TaxID=2873249 RepID=UPI0033EBE9B7